MLTHSSVGIRSRDRHRPWYGPVAFFVISCSSWVAAVLSLTRYKQSVELSKADKIYKDAMETACDSGSADLAEALLRFFVDENEQECFTYEGVQECRNVGIGFFRPWRGEASREGGIRIYKTLTFWGVQYTAMWKCF